MASLKRVKCETDIGSIRLALESKELSGLCPQKWGRIACFPKQVFKKAGTCTTFCFSKHGTNGHLSFVCKMHICALATELVQKIVFGHDLSPMDVLSVALSCREMHYAILGPVGNVNQFDLTQMRALGGVLFCTKKGWSKAAILALKRGIGSPTEEKNYAITLAARQGFTTLVRMLLQTPFVDPSVQDNRPLIEASKYGHIDVLSLLLADPRCDPSARYSQCLTNATNGQHIDCLRFLLADPRVDPCGHEYLAALTAVETSTQDVVMMFFEHPRFNYLEFSRRFIDLIINYGHCRALDFLLSDPRFNPSIYGNKALQIALNSRRIQMVKLLLDCPRTVIRGYRHYFTYFASTNKAAATMLFENARVLKHFKDLWMLCMRNRHKPLKNFSFIRQKSETCNDGKMSIDQFRVFNTRAAYWACKNGNSEVFSMVYTLQIFDTAFDEDRCLYIAAENGHLQIVKKLLQDPVVDPSRHESSAFRQACENGHTKIAMLLLQDRRVDPSAVDNHAFRLAAENGHSQIVRILMSDARINPHDMEDYALYWATQNDHHEITKMIQQLSL